MREIPLTVKRPSCHTTCVLGDGAVERLPEHLPPAACALLVIDRAVAGAPVVRRLGELLGEAGVRVAARTSLAGGEASKTLRQAAQLWSSWTAAKAARDAVALAIGGGSTSDLTGFAAACFLRGIPWIAVPTTTLSMADAALGGKTAVNAPEGKNLVGAFHHPRAVIADLGILQTLPREPYLDGWAEVVKAGVVSDASLLERLERDARAIADERRTEAVEAALAGSLEVKAEVVARDPDDLSIRSILNFGHGVAHALETATGGAITHGRAVAVGMAVEARLGARHGWLESGVAERVERTCRLLGLDPSVPAGLSADRLAAALAVDKKRRGGRFRLALPAKVGGFDPDRLLFEVAAEEVLGELA